MIPYDRVSTGPGKVTHRLWWELGAPLHPFESQQGKYDTGTVEMSEPAPSRRKKPRKTADVAAKGIEKLN